MRAFGDLNVLPLSSRNFNLSSDHKEMTETGIKKVLHYSRKLLEQVDLIWQLCQPTFLDNVTD